MVPGPVRRHLHFTTLNSICHFSDHLTNLSMSSCNFCYPQFFTVQSLALLCQFFLGLPQFIDTPNTLYIRPVCLLTCPQHLNFQILTYSILYRHLCSHPSRNSGSHFRVCHTCAVCEIYGSSQYEPVSGIGVF